MPIVIDPTFTPPAPPTSVTSSDGHLTVYADEAQAGALLVADFSELAVWPSRVRFARADGTLVRSGNDALAPGGIAVAYDHEAPLGGPVSWTATPVTDDETLGDQSTAAAVDLPFPTGRSHLAWLKAVGTSQTASRIKVREFKEDGRDPRSQLGSRVGGRAPVGSRQALSSLAATLVLRTETKAEHDELLAILDAQVMLLQAPEWMGIPSDLFLMLTGAVASERVGGHNRGWAARVWSLSVVEVDRPATVDAPLYVPGRSWADVAQSYASWDALASTVPSWVSLLGGTA